MIVHCTESLSCYIASSFVLHSHCIRSHSNCYTCSVVEDYAKWQLLVDALSLYVAPLPDDNWKILRDVKFPKTSKLSDDTKLTCVEFLEAVMPLAMARPFVEEFITNSTEVKVNPSNF